MTLHLQRKPDTAMAQTLTIGAHTLVADASVAEGGKTQAPARMTFTMQRWRLAKRSR